MIKVVYWSGTGNTEAMAEAVGSGIESTGKDAKVVSVSDISVSELADDMVFALGCPAMGAEVLEEEEMEPFVSELEENISGKTIALFGSYGWGDGEWMREWTARMQNAGAAVLNGEGLMCQDSPDAESLAACEALGRQMAEV